MKVPRFKLIEGFKETIWRPTEKLILLPTMLPIMIPTMLKGQSLFPLIVFQ
ncbi:hypothetical protein BA6E_105132 [Bacteroidales bacterium 6E]|nr:hypothetical protein BA6E_105132 [Bacteroidales bacterium 6E]